MDGSIPSILPFSPPAHTVASGGSPAPAVTSAAEALAARRTDSVELSGAAPSVRATPATERVSKLVAATVEVPVDFEAARPAPADGAFQMYRRPADRNIAATGVSLGRRVDVTG